VSKEEASQYGRLWGEDDVQIETDPEDSDFVEEHGDPVTCVVQKILCSSTPHNDINSSTQGVQSRV